MNSLTSMVNRLDTYDWNKLAGCDFVQPLQPRHICELCKTLLKEPLQLSCGDLFCRLCVEPHLTNDAQLECPGCGEKLDADCPAFPDNSAKKEILSKLKVYCRNKSFGCSETLTLRDCGVHEDSCDFEPRECLYQSWGCQTTVTARDLESHHGACAFQPIECPHCELRVAKVNLNDPHLKEECLKVKTDCPFQCGSKELVREKLNEHKLVCPYRTESCPFEKIGCSFEGTLEFIGVHEKESNTDHLKMNFEKTLTIETGQEILKDKIRTLENENEALKKSLEERHAIFLANIDDLKKQLKDLVDKMHTVENEVYRLSNCVATTTSAVPSSPSTSPLSSTAMLCSAATTDSSTHEGVTAHQTAEAQVAEESLKHISKLDQSTDVVHEMKKEIKKLVKKMAELESKQSQTSLNRFHNGSEVSLASSTKSEPSIDRKLTLHDQWLKDLDLRLQISDTATYDGILIWKITEYARRKRNAENGTALSLYSQPFYTSKYGYKMCCRVYLNGDGLGKGSHMSLFFSIMKGEYDSLLRWPFKQKVTLQLLDQGVGGNPGTKHLVDSFRPDPKSNSFQKPTTEMNIASGCPLFVSQKVVEDSSLYKKDDTIYIKCIVDTVV